MEIFLISDLHLFHKRLLILEPGRSIFKDLKEMHETILINWNNTIKEDDIVYDLGDISFGPFDITYEYIQKLNGTKCLIMGSHDGRSKSWYERVGYAKVIKQYEQPFLLQDNILLSHEPIQILPSDLINIHGHIHSKNHSEIDYLTNRHYNVSVEAINYTPKSLNEILKEMSIKE